MLPNIIAVDGPAGSGKSTVSFAVARRIAYLFADTGAFYRAITFLALQRGLVERGAESLTALAQQTRLDMTPELAGDGRQFTLLADGQDITPFITAPAVDAHVSVVAAVPGVRAALLNTQRALAVRGRVIMTGRDIGTVVLPDADLKIYIDASLEKRAERRYHQRLKHNEPADYQAILDGLRQRDTIDSGRSVAPLLRAPDAVQLDTSSLTLEQAIEAMYRLIQLWRPAE